MTTVFVAAEKLMSWNSDGSLSVDEAVASVLTSYREDNRIIVYFAPVRFGLFFESRRETQQAWDYMASALRNAGFEPDDVILFEDAVEQVPFVDILATLDKHDRALLYSDDPSDLDLCDGLGIQKVDVLDAGSSSLWHRIHLRQVFKTLLAAIQA